MKKTILMIAMLLGSFAIFNAGAQIRFSINIGSQPIWGPTGYEHVEYYYLPDIDAYYYVPGRQYIYPERGRWIFANSLPPRFNFDPYNGYKVVVNEPYPYRHPEIYRAKYGGYKGQHNPEIIRNSRDPRYFQIKDHPLHNIWQNDQRKNQNRGNNRNRGRKG